MEFQDLARRIQPVGGLRAEEWSQHENGGGWTQRTTRVEASAFIGPFAIISGDAQILERARIVDEASVTGMAVVKGQALVGGSAQIGGQAMIDGQARILGTAEVGGFFTMTEGEIRYGIHRPLSPQQKLWME